MATVALCPRCSDDLFIPSGTDPNAWAQCPACNVLFQVKDATSRDLNEMRLVEPVPESAVGNSTEGRSERAYGERQPLKPVPTVAITSQQTVGDVESLASDDDVSLLSATVTDDAMPSSSPKRSAPTIEDDVQSSAPTWEERPPESEAAPATVSEPPTEPDPNLVSSQTIVEYPDLPTDPPASAGATVEISGHPSQEADADFELMTSSESLASQPTWDDSEHMERLLAGDGMEDDFEGQPTLDAPPPIIEEQATDENEFANEFVPAGDTLVNADFGMPMSTPRRRRRSPVRMLVGVVLSGIIGLGLGAIALLWLRGPSGDLFGIARYLPTVVLPPSYSKPPGDAGLAGEQSPIDNPANKQATYVEPQNEPRKLEQPEPVVVQPTQPTEPAPLGTPPAAPLEFAGKRPVIGAPTFTNLQLDAALQAATVAQPDLIKGDADDDGEAVRSAKGSAFWTLCDLADKLTFVDNASSPEEVSAAQSKAVDLFRQTLADAHTRGETARIVPRWLVFNRRNNGVFFAGTIADQNPKGSVVECRVDLGAGGEPLTILVPQQLVPELVASDRPIGVVGSIVDSPDPHVVGYEGTAARAVWVSRLISLE